MKYFARQIRSATLTTVARHATPQMAAQGWIEISKERFIALQPEKALCYAGNRIEGTAAAIEQLNRTGYWIAPTAANRRRR